MTATWSVQQSQEREQGGVGQAVRLVGVRVGPPSACPRTHSGLRGGGMGCRSPGVFSCQGGPGLGAEVALPAFPGAARPGADVSFSSLRAGSEEEVTGYDS